MMSGGLIRSAGMLAGAFAVWVVTVLLAEAQVELLEASEDADAL